jgi:hypothetical protein
MKLPTCCGMMPAELGVPHCRSNRYGLKLWFGQAMPTREHYEAQVIGADEVKGASVLAIEIGFHSEYPQPPENDAVLAHLATSERKWRRALIGSLSFASIRRAMTG